MTALLGLIPHLKPTDDLLNEGMFSLVHQEALLLNFRIQNLVAAAQIESGKVDITYASVNMESVVKEVVEDLKYTIKAKDIMISIQNMLTGTIVSDPQKLYLFLKYGSKRMHLRICQWYRQYFNSRIRIQSHHSGQQSRISAESRV
jgi:light-regulated signal transduction histidine kinase (bacteriophytochrome)